MLISPPLMTATILVIAAVWSMERSITDLGWLSGGTPVLQLNTPAVIQDNVDFAAANDGHNISNSGGVVDGTVNYRPRVVKRRNPCVAVKHPCRDPGQC